MAQHDLVVALARMETVYGTDPVPVAATHAVLLRDVNWTMDGEVAARPMALPFHGNDPFSVVARRCGLSGSIDLAGSGAAGTAPAYAPWLRACGLAEVVTADTDVTYSPISAAYESKAFYHFIDGIRHRGLGVRGDFSLQLPAKGLPSLTFTMMGLYTAPTGVALPAPTLTAWKDPVPVDDSNTGKLVIGANQYPFTNFRYSHGNQVVRRELPGRSSVIIAGRAPSLEFTIEAPEAANPDVYALAGTVQTITVQHGQVAGNIIDVSVKARLQPGYRYSRGDDGQLYITIQGSPEPTLAGNNEFSLKVR